MGLWWHGHNRSCRIFARVDKVSKFNLHFIPSQYFSASLTANQSRLTKKPFKEHIVINRPTFTTKHQAAACGGLLWASISQRSGCGYQGSTWSMDHLPSVISKQLPLGNSFETSLKLGGGGM